eukprot:SAG31_NODE_3895_length_3773_cov_21.681818_4_plen_108_part_00
MCAHNLEQSQSGYIHLTQPLSQVWCTKGSHDGSEWECVCREAPWGPRVLQYVAAFSGFIWVIGGQVSTIDPLVTKFSQWLPGWNMVLLLPTDSSAVPSHVQWRAFET